MDVGASYPVGFLRYGHKKVDYPLIETFNMQTFDIACVELADTATVLTVSVDARFADHNRICIGSGSYIQTELEQVC